MRNASPAFDVPVSAKTSWGRNPMRQPEIERAPAINEPICLPFLYARERVARRFTLAGFTCRVLPKRPRLSPPVKRESGRGDRYREVV